MTTTRPELPSSVHPISGRLHAGSTYCTTLDEANAYISRSVAVRDGVLAARIETDAAGFDIVLTVPHEYLYGRSPVSSPPVELVYRSAR